MKRRLLLSLKSREQKKEAPSCPSANNLSAMVCAIVLFPVPASPLSQYTGGLLKSFDQCSISSRMALRVLLRQFLRLPWRYSASCAQRKLLTTTASAVGGSCQASIIENGGNSDLGSMKRGYFIRPNAEGGHSLLVGILDHPSPFGSPSVALVNTI